MKPTKEILDSIDRACEEILAQKPKELPNIIYIDLDSKAAEYLIPPEKLQWLRTEHERLKNARHQFRRG